MGQHTLHVLTNEDVIEFRRLVKQEIDTLTPEKALKSLIDSGVLDADGKPRWPIAKGPKKTGKRGSKPRG